MGYQLAGFTVKLFGLARDLFAWPVIQLGIGPDGKPVPLQASSGGGAISAAQSVTPHASIVVPASTSQVIPTGAKGWTVTVLTGTATVNGAAAMPAGFSDSDPYTTLADITVTPDAASTAYVRWNT